MKNQCHKYFCNPVLHHDSSALLALALTLALLLCSRLGAAQTLSQTPAAKRESGAKAGNIKNDAVHAMALQPDGKIIVAGRTCRGNSIRQGMTARDLECNFALARYLVDGTLDSSFGQDGKVVTDFAGNYDRIRAVALQPDGKILLVGDTDWNDCDSDFALARYNSDGTLDSPFGQRGKVVTDFFGGKDEALAVAIQGDGRIVVAGRAGNHRMNLAIARYTQRGIPDTTFGKNGKVVTPSDHFMFTSSISLQPDGKISIVGSSSTCTANCSIATTFALARYHRDGRLDPDFANKGTVVTSWCGPTGIVSAIAVQPDGKSIMAGDTNIEGRRGYFALQRINEDGSLDNSFGDDGKIATLFNHSTRPKAIGLFPDGSFIVAGSASKDPSSESKAVSLARYSKNGELDLSFGKEGKVITPCGGTGEGEASAIALQPDGKIIAGGYSETGDLGDYLLMRFNKDGSLDSAFGSGGRVYTDFNGIMDKSSTFDLKRGRKPANCTGGSRIITTVVGVVSSVIVASGQPVYRSRKVTGVPNPPPAEPTVREPGSRPNATAEASATTPIADSMPPIQLKVIDFIATEGGSKGATIYVNDQNLLLDFNDTSESTLFTAEALVKINHRNKTYRVYSYTELEASIVQKVSEFVKSQQNNGARRGVEYRLTEETDIIAGLKARKLIKLSNGAPEQVIWVSRDLVPVKVGAFGERIMSLVPKDYLRGTLEMSEVIMVYGIPLRLDISERNRYRVRIEERLGSALTFQAPPSYRRIEK